MKYILITLNLLFAFKFTTAQKFNSYKFENVVNNGSKTIFKDGVGKIYYIENGISITTSLSTTSEYGKYYDLSISLENLTGKNLLFVPNSIIVYLTSYSVDKKTKIKKINVQKEGKVLSSDDYMKRVNNRQSLSSTFKAIGETLSAQSAGYSSSKTVSSANGYTNSYGSIGNYYLKSPLNVSSSSSTSISGVSNTQSYNGKAAYDALQNAKNEIKQYNEELYQIKTELYQKYLRINTLEHQQRILGDVYVEYENADKIEILIPVNGKYYSFIYGNSVDNIQQNDNEVQVVSPNPEVNKYYSLAKSAYNNKQTEKAIQLLAELLQAEPTNFEALYFKGQIEANSIKDYKSAKNTFTLAIKENPQSEDVLMARAYCYKELKYFDSSNMDAYDALEINPKKINALLQLGLNKSAQKDYIGSNNEYNRIIQIAKNNLNYVNNLGLVYNNLGYNLLKMNDLKNSMLCLNKAIELQPNSSFIWGSRGELYYRLREYKKAVNDLSNGISIEESGIAQDQNLDPSLLYYNRALCLIEMRKDKDACIDLNKAFQLGNLDAQKISKQICK
jgi:tetratricopeptide (TPR) repeat protein